MAAAGPFGTRRLRLAVAIGALLGGIGRAELFGPAATYVAGADAVRLAVADFDGDGDLDVAVGHLSAENRVSVLENDGVGALGPADRYDVMPEPQPFDPCCKPISVAAGDLDDDGDADLAVLLHDIGTVRLLLNDGSGTFALDAADYVVNGAPPPVHSEIAVAAHLTGSRIDLVVASPSASGDGVADGHVSVLLDRGKLPGFDVTEYDPVAGHHPEGVAAADVDDDGDNDLVVPSSISNDVLVLVNDGTGGFALSDRCADLLAEAGARCFPLGHRPSSITAADFDGDGDPDVALATSDVTGDALAVRYDDGTGDFSVSGIDYVNLPGAEVEVFDNPIGVAAGDFDCDGAPDLAVANRFAGTVAVLRNRNLGPGVPNLFAFEDHYDVGLLPWEPVAADLDGDGALDLTLPSGGDDVAVLLNLGCAPRLAFLCRAAKLAAAGKAAQALLACHARAAKQGESAGAACLAKARAKLTAVFAKTEAKGGCLTTGDTSTLQAAIDTAVAEVAADLAAPAASLCAAAKLRAAGRKAGGRLGCHARAAKRTELIDAACLAKVEDALASAFADAESQGDCATSGDAAAIAARLDALAVGAVDMLAP